MQTDEQKARAAEIMRVRKEQGVDIFEAEAIVDGKRNVTWDGPADVAGFKQEVELEVASEESAGHADRAHSAVVGGSSASRVMNCPGSVELSLFFPEKETSTYAEEGTALHEAVEHILDKGLDGPEIIGHTFNGFEITKDLYNSAVVPALEMLDEYEEEVGPLDFALEARVAIPEIEGAFGTVDLPAVVEDRGIIWDWKFGAGVPVEAEHNSQMMFYAHGVRSDPKYADMLPRDKPIEIIIAQPRMDNGFKRWMTDHEQLDIFIKELTKAVEVARNPMVVKFAQWLPGLLKTLYSGDERSRKHAVQVLTRDLDQLDEQFQSPVFKTGSHCRWCKAKKGCPLLNLDANQALRTSQADLEKDISEWLAAAEQLKDWIREIEQWAFRRLEDGHEVKGYKLVAKNARRKWADEEAAEGYFSSMRSVKADEFAPRKMLSVAQMEKLLKSKGKELPSEFVLKESSGMKMVPEDAPGEPVNLTPQMLEGLTKHLE